MDFKELSKNLMHTAFKAGRVIMEIHQEEIKFELKSDNSPVTLADQAAEDIILKDLSKLTPNIPVVAEEAVQAGVVPNVDGGTFYLVDPLDGTREFIKRGDQFTVNIGLIENGQPSFGVVYAPALQEMYVTIAPNQAQMARLDPFAAKFQLEDVKSIQTRQADEDGFIVAVSRSHLNEKTKTLLQNYKIVKTISASSSLKFCLLAKGDAHIYPRLGPTMEWDTAAGQAVLQAAGGCVTNAFGEPLIYGKREEGFPNPGFVAWAKSEFIKS